MVQDFVHQQYHQHNYHMEGKSKEKLTSQPMLWLLQPGQEDLWGQASLNHWLFRVWGWKLPSYVGMKINYCIIRIPFFNNHHDGKVSFFFLFRGSSCNIVGRFCPVISYQGDLGVWSISSDSRNQEVVWRRNAYGSWLQVTFLNHKKYQISRYCIHLWSWNIHYL